jgi:MFS family permease
MLMNALTTLRNSFSPLKIRNFRVYLGGQGISMLGTWMQATAQAWVVWQLTGSTEQLGIVAMLNTLPLLVFGPWTGVWADRLDRRRVLIGTQIAAAILAAALAILVQTNTVQMWHLYILSTLLGMVNALDFPAQQAFLGDLSGAGEVRKAVVMNAMILNVGRVVGPTFAGFTIGILGVASAFWLNALSFIAVIITLLMITTQQVKRPSGASVLHEFSEGLRYVAKQPRMQDLIIFAIMVTFFGLPVLNILSSVATDILHGQAEILGILLGSSGAGALTSALLIVPIAQSFKRTGIVVGAAVGWMGIWLIIFSQSVWLPLSMLSMFCFSIGAPIVLTTSLGMVQLMAPADMKARLLSLMVMVSFGFQPFGSLLIGFSAERLGTGPAILVNGLLLIASSAVLLIVRPKLRSWQANAHPIHTSTPLPETI